MPWRHGIELVGEVSPVPDGWANPIEMGGLTGFAYYMTMRGSIN